MNVVSVGRGGGGEGAEPPTQKMSVHLSTRPTFRQPEQVAVCINDKTGQIVTKVSTGCFNKCL